MSTNTLQLNVVNFNKNAYVAIEGKASNNCFYIIRSGAVSVNREALKSETEKLNLGDFFGVISAMANHNHIETTQTLTNISAIMVQKDQFPLLIQKNNPVAMKIILSFSKKLRELDQSITELTLKTSSSVQEDVVNLYKVGRILLLKKINSIMHSMHSIDFCNTVQQINLRLKQKQYILMQLKKNNLKDFILIIQ